MHYDVVPSMLTSGERRKVLCTMPEHGEGDVFTPLLQFLINQSQQLILGKNEFQYILLTEYFIQQLSLHEHKPFIMELQVNKKVPNPMTE